MLSKIFNEENIPPTQQLTSRHSATFCHNSASEEAQTPSKSDGILIGNFFTFYPIFPSHTPPRKHERAQAIPHPYISMYETHRESDGSSNRRGKKEAIWVVEESYIGRRADLYWSVTRPILLHAVTNICSTRDQYETVAGECCPLFRALRHRAPSPPICLSKVIRKPFDLSRVFLLSSGRKGVLLMKKKAPSHSGFLLSRHVVLKTRHINPNIYVRRY